MKLALVAFAFLSLNLAAETFDKSTQEALDGTMELLRSPGKRDDAIKGDAKAKAADAQVKALAGDPATTQKLYELSALIMENLVKQANGDPEKMMKILEAAQKDPSAFANTWSPEQRQMLKDLGQQIEKKRGGKSVP